MNETWAKAMGFMVHGIYVLTTSYQGEINGMIASWVSQVSYEPPLIMVAIHPDRYSHRFVERGGAFALHVISKEQKDLLSRFKGPDPAAKFAGIRWAKGITGAPVLQDCIAYFECNIKTSFRPGNHTLFLGEVVGGGLVSPGVPLSSLDYEGFYRGDR